MAQKKSSAAKPPVSKVKLVLAALGVFFCGVVVVKMVSAVLNRPDPPGPSELALNPGKQDEILAGRRARELQEELGLSEKQTAEISAIIADAKGGASEIIGANKGDVRGLVLSTMAKRREATDRIRRVLTKEQRTQFDAMLQARQKKMFNAIKKARKQRNP